MGQGLARIPSDPTSCERKGGCYSPSHWLSHTCTQSYLESPIFSGKHSIELHTHIHPQTQSHTCAGTHRSKSLDPLNPFLSHRGGPPALFDWFFEAAYPASLQEGESGAVAGGGEMEGGPGALHLVAHFPSRSPHPAAVPPRLPGPGMQAGSFLPPGPGPVPWGEGTQCLGPGPPPGALRWGPTQVAKQCVLLFIPRNLCRWCLNSASLLMWKGMEGSRPPRTQGSRPLMDPSVLKHPETQTAALICSGI